MYPKVKVRVQGEEADQYDYEKVSLQSLKAFEWLSSHNFTSTDDSPGSVVRVPRTYYPKTPPPSFLSSQGTNKEKTVVEENQKNVRATSAPRPRAVLSSPDNDGIIGGRTHAKRQLFSGLKKRDSSQNRHTQCKIFPKSAAAEGVAPTKGLNKESAEPKSDNRTKSRTAVTDSRIRGGQRKKTILSSILS
ncbi:hypothetical protein ACS0TY_026532 [Phlomoides rotata]